MPPSVYRPELVAAGCYLMSAEHPCHHCAKPTLVFALLLRGPFEERNELDLPVDPATADVLTVGMPRELPGDILEAMRIASNGCFYQDFSHTAEQDYWMNHCGRCGTKIGDWFIHKPGEAFFPTDPAELSRIAGRFLEGPFVFVDPACGYNGALTEWARRFENQ